MLFYDVSHFGQTITEAEHWSDILIIVELGVLPSAWQLSMNSLSFAVINESTVGRIFGQYTQDICILDVVSEDEKSCGCKTGRINPLGNHNMTHSKLYAYLMGHTVARHMVWYCHVPQSNHSFPVTYLAASCDSLSGIFMKCHSCLPKNQYVTKHSS